MPTILKSREARANSLEIDEYILGQSHSEETALNVHDAIFEDLFEDV